MKASEMIDAAKLAALIVGGYLAYRAWRKVQADGLAGAASSAVTGTVKGIGSVFGIPDTDASACAKAKAAGDGWAASFACPAGDFLSWQGGRLVDGVTGVFKSDTTPKRQASSDDHTSWVLTQQGAWGQQTFNQAATNTNYNPFGLF